MDCTFISVDERISRLREVTRAMKMQRQVLKANLKEITNEYNAETKKANQAHTVHKNAITAYKNAMVPSPS